MVLTIGHSTRTMEQLVDLLTRNGVTTVVDIRTIPRSRHNPQFNKDVLPGKLSLAGISYRHCPGLGGLRHPQRDSPNTGWRNSSFRGFADYMQTGEFAQHIDRLVAIAQVGQVAIFCAEAVPWRCHRSLIADALLIRGLRIEHIIGAGERRPHIMTPWAEVHGTTITYPPSAETDNAH